MSAYLSGQVNKVNHLNQTNQGGSSEPNKVKQVFRWSRCKCTNKDINDRGSSIERQFHMELSSKLSKRAANDYPPHIWWLSSLEIVITQGRHHLGRGGRCRSSQNPGIAKIGLPPLPLTPILALWWIWRQKRVKATRNILTTKVRKWPFLGVNDYFLGKCSLIVGDDQFWGISAHFLGVNDHYLGWVMPQ